MKNKTDNIYEHWLERQAQSGNYFIFFRYYLAVMSTDSAIVMQSLINLGKHKSDGGWILCMSAYLEQELFMTKRVIDRVIKELKSLGYIEVVVHGMPPKRYIRVDLRKINQDVDKSLNERTKNSVNKRSQKHQNVPIDSTEMNLNKSNPTDYSNKQAKQLCPLGDSGATPPHAYGDQDNAMIDLPGLPTPRKSKIANKEKLGSLTVSPEIAGYARLLMDKVQEANHDCKQSSLKSWGRWLQKCQSVYGPDRFKATIEWYLPRIKECTHDERMVQCFAGESFYRKFIQVESAMKRDQKRNPTVEITDTAKGIAERLNNLNWPKDSEKDLPTAAQILLNEFNGLNDRLNYDDLKDKSLILVMNKVEEELRPLYDAEWWLRNRVHKRIRKWEAWDGKILPLLPTIQSNEFAEQFGYVWAEQASGNRSNWRKLLKELGYA